MGRIEVRHEDGDRYTLDIRGHGLVVDQPDTGDAGPTPTELWVAGLVSCVAFYAGAFCRRHDVDAAGLAVHGEWAFAEERPQRVGAIDVSVTVPAALPDALRPRLQAVVEHCTVHTSMLTPPEVTIELRQPDLVGGAR